MTEDDAAKLIANLTKKNKLFELRGFQTHATGMSLLMKKIDRTPNTITQWIENEGYYVLYFGAPMHDGERCFLAEIRC